MEITSLVSRERLLAGRGGQGLDQVWERVLGALAMWCQGLPDGWGQEASPSP